MQLGDLTRNFLDVEAGQPGPIKVGRHMVQQLDLDANLLKPSLCHPLLVSGILMIHKPLVFLPICPWFPAAGKTTTIKNHKEHAACFIMFRT